MRRLQLAVTLGALLFVAAPATATAQEPDEEEAQQAEADKVRAEARAQAREAREMARTARLRARGSGGYLGVALRDVSGEDAGRLGLSGEFGALIESVTEESPAAEAGLQEGDVITSWNGERVESVAQLSRLARETPPGRSVSLGVQRDGSEQTISVTLGDRAEAGRGFAYAVNPEMRERMRVQMEGARERMHEAREHMRGARERLRHCAVEVESDEGGRHVVIVPGGRGRMGVQLNGLTEQLGEYFGLQGDAGALVTSVREESPAAAAGVQAGDVITAVGGTAVEGPRDVARAVRDAEAGPMAVTVVRRGEERQLTVQLEERSEEECEDIFVAPEGAGSFEWRSDDGHAYVMPHRALAPLMQRLHYRMRAPHAPHRAPGEVEAPIPPAAPAPAVRTI